MSSVWGVDSSAGHKDGQGDQRQKKTLRMREPAPLRHDGIYRGDDWPFLYVYEKGRCLINAAPRRRTAGAKYEEEARW